MRAALFLFLGRLRGETLAWVGWWAGGGKLRVVYCCHGFALCRVSSTDELTEALKGGIRGKKTSFKQQVWLKSPAAWLVGAECPGTKHERRNRAVKEVSPMNYDPQLPRLGTRGKGPSETGHGQEVGKSWCEGVL